MATAVRTVPVDFAWAERNLGLDCGAPAMALGAVATPAASDGDLKRAVIDFDSEAPEGDAFRSVALAAPGGLSKFVEITWPDGLAPRAGRKPRGVSLPKADVLVVTWTVDEGHALSRVLTPGKDSRNDYLSYKHNFTRISKKMRKGCPALNAGRLGAYWTTTIGKKTVVVFKSDSHMSQDTVKRQPANGETLPNEDVWKQII